MSTETSLSRTSGGRLTASCLKKVRAVLAKPGVSLRAKTQIKQWLSNAPTVVPGSAIDQALIEGHAKRPIW